MDTCAKTTLSYAAVVKDSVGATPAETETRPKSWYDQMESDMSRSNSLSTILSDDTITCTMRSSNSHSVSDSGQASDMSSDNEMCSAKSSHNGDVIHFEELLRNRKMQLKRRESIDSCYTTSSTCTDANCASNDQLQLMCQRWTKIHKEYETDTEVLTRRQKQIDYGKNTIGYGLYQNQVTIDQRTSSHPHTPDKNSKYSRRAFDGLIKIWRKQLHQYDPVCANEAEDLSPIDQNNMEETA